MTSLDDAALDALIEDLGSPFALASAAPSPAETARALRQLRAENAELRARLADMEQETWDADMRAALAGFVAWGGPTVGQHAVVRAAFETADVVKAERAKWIAGRTE